MKKLLFATALGVSVVGFGATAAPVTYNATSFEGYTANASVLTGKGDIGETGATGNYFCYTDGDADGSLVKTFGEDNLAVPSITRPFYYASATPNANYLELSTEGGILWRSINEIEGSANAYTLGAAQSVAATGTYLDTLVQFTPTEDGVPPELTSDDKLAIWLNVDSSNNTTNLMVRANFWDYSNDEMQEPVATSFALAGVSVEPGQWYRLTVKAIPSVLNGTVFPAFQIFIDGAAVAATSAPYSEDFQEFVSSRWVEGMATLAAANKLFPTLVEHPADIEDVTLRGVGFKGSGALDDLVWTEEDPFANAGGDDDYKVTINGSDVVVTPSAEDLAAVQAAVVAGGGTLDVTDVDAVNAALAAEIGSTGIPSWQALFLGLPPTEAGLESFKIDSISFDEDGNVVVTLPSTVDPKTGRGVDITIKLQSANTPDATSWTDVESASGTTFAPVQPGLGETKKFYKVVVEFAASSAQN